MSLPEIVKLSNGRIDTEYEREIALLWLNEKQVKWQKIIDNTRRNFYLLKKRTRENKVYICCTSNIGTKNNAHFWFGLEHKYFQANPDMGLILIAVWENKVRDYICLPNSFVRLWVKYWYKQNDYYSIDIDVKHGKYIMRYQKDYVYIDEYVNNSRKIFEKINFLDN